MFNVIDYLVYSEVTVNMALQCSIVINVMISVNCVSHGVNGALKRQFICIAWKPEFEKNYQSQEGGRQVA